MNIQEQIANDEKFILSVISARNWCMVSKEYFDYLEHDGYQAYYDMCIDITNELLFGEGSEYLKALKSDCVTGHYHNLNTCFDWYYMAESEKIIRERLKNFKCECI